MLQRLAIASLLWSACLAQDNSSRMEQVVQSYVSSKQFMGAVLVAGDKNILLNKVYGFADWEWDVPNSPATKFRLGSVTKQFILNSQLASLLEQEDRLQDCCDQNRTSQALTAWRSAPKNRSIPFALSFADSSVACSLLTQLSIGKSGDEFIHAASSEVPWFSRA